MNFLQNINWLYNTHQYQAHWNILMWLSKYRDSHNGKGMDIHQICKHCHISHYEYICAKSGSPLVTVPTINRISKYMKTIYLKSKKDQQYENN